MRNFYLILILHLPIFGMARVWTVDNSPFSAADSTYLQGVIIIASSGDTIIVMPSLTTYGSVNVTKKLFIYSSGFSAHLKGQDIDRAPIIGVTAIQTSGAGTVLAGMVFTSVISSYGAGSKFICNHIYGTVYLYANQHVLEGNLLSGFYTASMVEIASAINHTIQNNYFDLRTNGRNLSNSYAFIKGGDTGTMVRNNVFIELVDNGGAISNGGIQFFQNSRAKIHNNILWSNVTNRTNFQTGNSGSVFSKNITYSANSQVDTLPGVNYNDTMPLFEGGYNNSLLPFFRNTNKMQLKSTSIGKGGGTDNTDPGLFGRGYTYNMYGIPHWLMQISELTIQNATVKQNKKIKVNLKIQP